MRFTPGCCRCGGACADATVNASASCNGVSIAGGTFTLRDSTDSTTLATQTGTTASFTGLDGTLSYKVRWSKTGYHTKTSSLLTPGCGGTSNYNIGSWPTTYSLTVNVKIKTCDLAGVTVAVTGDATGSGSTDGSGNVTLSLTSTSTNEVQSLSYTATPPSGHGAAVKTGSFSVHACSPATQNVGLLPSTGHVSVVCNRRYMPEDVTGTDDYGSCTCSFNGDPAAPMWEGSYTYTSSRCIAESVCTPPLPGLYPDATADVTVALALIMRPADSDCDESDFDVSRKECLAEGGTCPTIISPTISPRCQPVADSAASDPTWDSLLDCVWPPEADYAGEGLDQMYSCPSSVSIDFTIPGVAAVTCAAYEETAVDVNFSGTIS